MASSPEPAVAALADAARPIAGVRLASAATGLRYRERDDFVIIELPPDGAFACLYTQNRFCAAPVVVARRHQAAARPRYLAVNAGNANAGTGVAGERAALATCEAVADAAGCSATEVLPYSTGVIGEQLDAAVLGRAVSAMLSGLAEDGWARAAAAILTTDTRPKLRSATVRVGDCAVTVTGMAKGSGMIKPDMATMLAYVATDAAVSDEALDAIARQAAAVSFNAITVDGDTSTNDAFALFASGAAGNAAIERADGEDYAALAAAVELVCGELARDIVRDGEGATKFVTIRVSGGASEDDCRRVGYTVAESPLVKTALFASDANWGRILAAVGRAEIAALDLAGVDISIGSEPIVRGGEPVADYDEDAVTALMEADEIDILIGLGAGRASADVWTCDLSHDYIRINAEYRS